MIGKERKQSECFTPEGETFCPRVDNPHFGPSNREWKYEVSVQVCEKNLFHLAGRKLSTLRPRVEK